MPLELNDKKACVFAHGTLGINAIHMLFCSVLFCTWVGYTKLKHIYDQKEYR